MTTDQTLMTGEILGWGYGSNLDTRDWESFCRRHCFDPACVEPVGPAYLPDHELVFDYYSGSRGGGALNLRPRVGQVVEGVLFRVTEEGWRALDRKEGHPKHYERWETVALLADGSEAPVRTYRACAHRITSFQRPTPEYLEICRRGRAAFGLSTRMLDAVAEGREAEIEVLGAFYYGTLARGGERFPIVERSGLKCTLMARAFGHLHDCGPWPALTLPAGADEFDGVHGDFVIPEDLPELLEQTDRIEGFHGFGRPDNFFRRTLQDVDVDHGRPRRAWVYVLDELPEGARRIEVGCWRRHRRLHGRFVRALVQAHAEGVEDFATQVARAIVPPVVAFDPSRDGLTLEQVVEAVVTGELAERRLAQVSDRWATVPRAESTERSVR